MDIELKNKFKSLEDFQKYVNENQIKTSVEFSKEHKPIYNLLLKSGESDKIVYFCKQFSRYDIIKIYNGLNSLSDFQNFINKYKIKSYKEMFSMSTLFTKRMKELEVSHKIIYYGKIKPPSEIKYTCVDISKFNVVSDFQEFINENEVYNARELCVNFYAVYNRLRELGLSNEVRYFNGKDPTSRALCTSCNTLEDFQKVIYENNIKDPRDLKERLGKSFYNKLCTKGFADKIKYIEERIRPEHLDWEKNDFQEFINKNKIERMVDIRKNYENIYSTILRKGYHAEDFIFPKTDKLHHYTYKEAYSDIIEKCKLKDYEFINKDSWEYINKDVSNIELKCNKHGTIWKTSYACFIISDNGCPSCAKRRSRGEEYAETFFREKGMYVETQAHFDFIGKKSIDLYFPEYNMAVEVQSELHLFDTEYHGGVDGFNKRVQRDKDKYKECTENGITLLYYIHLDTMNSSNRAKCLELIPSYFSTIYTDINDLWIKIQEIIKTKQK